MQKLRQRVLIPVFSQNIPGSYLHLLRKSRVKHSFVAVVFAFHGKEAKLVLTLLVLAMHVHAVMEDESLQDCVKKEEACVRCMQEINKEKKLR
jgi:hypothetical protein